ncbi:hypothetical protein BTUL_0047g00010 [Botrytis tulipae]|uniref:NWD NACHT-NTPase N-terminal domain-containing protein n=1 Tax=Botrytis tulipae TaxID=87230 RepID=A0A4Z1ETS9_9HELO|nr:hypothetical protein BTUL_0047g00010 [Botrytis tulipae]
MDSKRRFFKGLRRKQREEQANDSIGNGEPAPKVETPKGAIADLISAASGSTAQHLYHLAPQATNATLTNQIPVSKSGKTFRSRAYASLSESSPDLSKTYETLLLNTNINNLDTQELNKQEQMAATVQNRVDIMESKQWTIEISGKSLKVKDQVKGIMEAFQKVKELGTALASIDPIIFGLPWAGVSFLLTNKLVLSDFERNETLLDGLETIADIIARYTEIESLYLKTAVTGDLGIQLESRVLESRVVKLYACILKYQAKAACYLSKSTPIRFMRNLPKLDDWSKLLTEVTSEDEKYYKWTSLQDSRVLREIHDRISIQPSTITPPYFEVPTGRKIPHFIGRREILARVDSAHLRSSSSKAGMVVLRGIGGKGKTQIALEYCHMSRSKFEAVLWVDASSENSVIRNFETIYAKIKGSGNDCGSGDTKLDFVKNTIRTWNFGHIPHSIQGSVLVTTSHKDVDALVKNTAAAIELLGLPDKEALQLLYQQSGTEENEFNEMNGLSIVESLGYHALAITQAGAYIKNLKLDFPAFESHYSRRREDILKYQIPMNKYTKLLSDFEKETVLNVFATWELSFDELKAQSKWTDLEELLTILAFFDPLDISEELFSGFHASTNGEYHVSLHPLVKDWIRLRTKEALCEEYTVLAAEMIAALAEIYFPEVTNFPEVVFVFLYAHEENIGYITTPDVVEGSYDESPNKQYFFSYDFEKQDRIGKTSEKTIQTEEANKLFTEIFSFASTWAVLDGDEEGDGKILDFMDDLGSTLENLNRYEDSLALSQQRLKLGNDLLSLDAQLRYARMLRYLAKKEKAEELARDALQRLKESCGEESIEFRRWNEDWGSQWIDQTNKVLKDLDAYYEQVLGSADDVTDEERYAALGAWVRGQDTDQNRNWWSKDEIGRFGTLGSNMQVMDIYSTCQVIDTKKVPGFFSRYPAAISVGATDVKSALSAVAREASQPDSRERRRALIRNSNAYGDPFSICHCSAEVERLILLASIIEVMWIHDDVTEELDHGAACREHSALAEVLKIDVQPSDFTSKNARQSTLATVLRKAIDLDPEKAPRMIETLQDYLATFDSRDDDFDRMEEYMPYRVANCGYWQQYDFTMGNILGLTNDYFSWNIEKNQTTDRIRNGVRVLIKQHNITPDAAKSLLLGLIVEEESKAARLKKERLERPISHELSIYFEAIELYVGGSCFWHATAPRYRVFE